MQKIKDDIYYVGVNDRVNPLFEGMWPLPWGISYNSYLICDEKVAVTDCVGEEFFSEYLDNIREVIGDRLIDYIIVNHMEPDHTGALRLFRKYYPKASIVGNRKTMQMIDGYYGVRGENDITVSDGTVLCLGSHELEFHLTPMIHWPETMMTYDRKSCCLFSGDAFGSFGALAGTVLDTEMDIEPIFPEMRRYYSNIVGKYGIPVQNAMRKLSFLKTDAICPTHGPVWTEHIPEVLKEYDMMSRWEGREGLTVVYASMYGNTRRMAESIARGAATAGLRNIRVFDAGRTSLSEILGSIFTYSGLALGATTYNTTVNPSVKTLMEAVKLRELKHRVFGAFGSFTWAGKATREIAAFAEALHFYMPAETIEMKQGFSKETEEKCIAMGKALAQAVKENKDKELQQ